MKGRFSVLAVAVFAILLLGNWADRAQAQEGQDGSGSERDGRGDVTLEIRGDQGTRFSGTCSVGEERREISGTAPQSFEFDLEGRSLSCEVAKQGSESNELEVVLDGENVHAEQRLAGGEQGTSQITYDGNGSVSATSLSSKTARDEDRGSSLSKAEQKALENLDERIGRTVGDILERATL